MGGETYFPPDDLIVILAESTCTSYSDLGLGEEAAAPGKGRISLVGSAPHLIDPPDSSDFVDT